jgi:hypothetical protein
MSYSYEVEKQQVFKAENQKAFLGIRDNAKKIIGISGCATMGKLISHNEGPDSWFGLACVDRLVEMGELKEIAYGECAGQYRIFTMAS